VERERAPALAERERPREAEASARPPVRPASGAALSAAAMAGLAGAGGNAAVSRLLARQPTATPVGPLREAYDKARVERDAFAKSAKRGPQTYDPAKRKRRPTTTTAASTSSTTRPGSS
jgi:hypothetical protein